MHKISLSKKEFLKQAENGRIPPLFTEIPYCSPFDIYPRVYSGPGSILLESVKGPEKIARYSFITADPYASMKIKDGIVEIGASGKRVLSTKKRAKILERLKEFLNIYPQKPHPGLPPFQGGAVGLICYDFVHYFETLPRAAKDDLDMPDAFFYLADKVIAFDHFTKKAWIIISPGARDTGLGYGSLTGVNWAEIYERAEESIYELEKKINKKSSSELFLGNGSHSEIQVEHGLSKEDYMGMVRKTREYIAAGDIFQANLSLRLHAEIGGIHPWSIYGILREINPSPFACYMDFGDFQIVSSSPERLIRVREGTVDTRPIAGTRPRGKNIKDEEMRTELLLNEKEKAEHIMLIDLERNDLGRISDYGTVHVDDMMTTEDYSHVMHIVSNVKGKMAVGKTLFDCIRAAFPGGTITGVPKVRCMEIIDELEPVRRGPYTGSAGYLGFSGNMDLNIIIRSFLIKGQKAYVQAGAGIVADSDPEREYYESLKKAEALIETLRRLGWPR